MINLRILGLMGNVEEVMIMMQSQKIEQRTPEACSQLRDTN